MENREHNPLELEEDGETLAVRRKHQRRRGCLVSFPTSPEVAGPSHSAACETWIDEDGRDGDREQMSPLDSDKLDRGWRRFTGGRIE